MRLTLLCLCEGPSSPSASFEQDLQVLEAEAEAGIRDWEAAMRATVAVVYLVCFLVSFFITRRALCISSHFLGGRIGC